MKGGFIFNSHPMVLFWGVYVDDVIFQRTFSAWRLWLIRLFRTLPDDIMWRNFSIQLVPSEGVLEGQIDHDDSFSIKSREIF